MCAARLRRPFASGTMYSVFTPPERHDKDVGRTLATIKGNLFWAFAYDVTAVPLAMLDLLNPLIGAPLWRYPRFSWSATACVFAASDRDSSVRFRYGYGHPMARVIVPIPEGRAMMTTEYVASGKRTGLPLGWV
jgi:hypothetical protein